jgi:hypothetical protein
VTFQVVYRDEGEPAGVGKSLRGGDADQEGPDQTRPRRDSHAVDLVEGEIGVRQRILDHPVEPFEVGARGDFRNYAAVARVLGLGVDDVGEDATPVGLDDCRAGVVAGSFYRKDHGSVIALRAVRFVHRSVSSLFADGSQLTADSLQKASPVRGAGKTS